MRGGVGEGRGRNNLVDASPAPLCAVGHDGTRAGGNLPRSGIAHARAQRIIEMLEMVQAQELHGQRGVVDLGQLDGAGAARGQQRAVGQAGERVAVGQLFDALNETRPLRRVGVIGLGSGALSCYRHDGQMWTYFEIDPAVTALARDLRYFHHLAECAPDATVVHGDARLSLATEPDGRYDLLISDAFSSDSIPLHLVTREALQLFIRKLTPRGVLFINISNRNIDLEPVLGILTEQLGLAARIARYRPDEDERANSALNATWVVITRPDDEAFLDSLKGWGGLRSEPGTRPWTGDYSTQVGARGWWWRRPARRRAPPPARGPRGCKAMGVAARAAVRWLLLAAAARAGLPVHAGELRVVAPMEGAV